MIRNSTKRIGDIEKKLENLQSQIDRLLQILGYVRIESDFVYTGCDESEDAKDPYP